MNEKRCAHCGKIFHHDARHSSFQKYCSKACQLKANNEKKKQKKLERLGSFIPNDSALDDCVREARRLGFRSYGRYIAWRDRAIYGEGLQHEHIHPASVQAGLPPQEGRLCGNVPGMAGL